MEHGVIIRAGGQLLLPELLDTAGPAHGTHRTGGRAGLARTLLAKAFLYETKSGIGISAPFPWALLCPSST